MSYNLKISENLLELVPDSVGENDYDNYLLTALEVGLTALKQANITADTSIVSTKFNEVSENLKNKLIGENSELSNSINKLFKEADSPFRKALDPDNVDSPIFKFLNSQDERQKLHAKEILGLLRDLETHLIKEMLDIKEQLNIQTNVKDERSKGAAKGRDFEEEVLEDLKLWQKYSDEFIDTSILEEGKSRRKVGDILSNTKEGLNIVFEIKAGKDYADKGDKSLDKQMSEAMDYRKADGAISVTTVEAMQTKQWQNSIFMDRGGNKLIVAVDRDNGDFTIVRLAYMLLRERLTSDLGDVKTKQKSILPQNLEPIIQNLTQNMSSFKKLKQTITDIEGRINDMRKEVFNLEGNISSRSQDLKLLL